MKHEDHIVDAVRYSFKYNKAKRAGTPWQERVVAFLRKTTKLNKYMYLFVAAFWIIFGIVHFFDKKPIDPLIILWLSLFIAVLHFMLWFNQRLMDNMQKLTSEMLDFMKELIIDKARLISKLENFVKKPKEEKEVN